MKNRLMIFLILGVSLSMNAQGLWRYGLEVQGYPTGVIAGITSNIEFSNQMIGHGRLGYNLVRRGSQGVHEDERGGGFGGTVGLRYYFDNLYEGWFTELRSDLWFQRITYKDRIGAINQTTGTTNVTVLQPSIMAGYGFLVGGFLLSPTLAVGYEFNVRTNGAEVGQGPIVLIGFILNR